MAWHDEHAALELLNTSWPRRTSPPSSRGQQGLDPGRLLGGAGLDLVVERPRQLLDRLPVPVENRSQGLGAQAQGDDRAAQRLDQCPADASRPSTSRMPAAAGRRPAGRRVGRVAASSINWFSVKPPSSARRRRWCGRRPIRPDRAARRRNTNRSGSMSVSPPGTAASAAESDVGRPVRIAADRGGPPAAARRPLASFGKGRARAEATA